MSEFLANPSALPTVPLPRTSRAWPERDPSPWTNVVPLPTGYPPPGVTVVEIGGELDAGTAPRLRELLRALPIGPGTTIVLDLSAVRFLGVAALELLSDTRQHAEAHGTSFHLAACPRCVSRTLAVAAHLGRRPFQVHRTVTDAIAADPAASTG